MTVKVGNAEFTFDGYVQPLQSIQQLAEDCYQQGRTNMFEELKPTADMIAYAQGRADEQEFVEQRCRELGIDYTLIYTCQNVD